VGITKGLQNAQAFFQAGNPVAALQGLLSWRGSGCDFAFWCLHRYAGVRQQLSEERSGVKPSIGAIIELCCAIIDHLY
jgi:hypothetical protein